MIRILTQFLVNLASSAVAFLVAWWTVPTFELEWGGFFIAIGVFTLAQTILGPFVFNMARQYAAPMLGGIGLVSTLLALWIASLFPGGLTIDGVGNWVLAALVVWFITALGGWILLALLARRAKRKRETKQEQQLIAKIERDRRDDKGSAAG